MGMPKPAMTTVCILFNVQVTKKTEKVPEGAHRHAEAGDDLVDGVGVQPRVHEQAGGLRVGRKDTVDAEAGAVAHHHARLLDARTVLHHVQHHLQQELW